MSENYAVLFDMDGVIFDSERALRAVWLELAAEQGLGDMERVYARCLGVTREVTGSILREEYGEDFPWEAFREETGRLPLKPGAREILRALGERGAPLALASSTQRALVLRELEEAGLLPFFDAVVCGDEVRRSKPEPEIFLTAAARLGAEPGRCFVIEDSFNGVRAGHAAGMRVLMVPDLLPPSDEIRRLAEAVLPDLYAAERYLRDV